MGVMEAYAACPHGQEATMAEEHGVSIQSRQVSLGQGLGGTVLHWFGQWPWHQNQMHLLRLGVASAPRHQHHSTDSVEGQPMAFVSMTCPLQKLSPVPPYFEVNCLH
jgi:hypothetical protein